jgi:hypothetical protein
MCFFLIAVSVEVIETSKATTYKFSLGQKQDTIGLSVWADSNGDAAKYIMDLIGTPIVLGGCSVWRNEQGQVKSINFGPKTTLMRPVLSASVKVQPSPLLMMHSG